MRILDLGPGTGILALRLTQHQCQGVGVNPSTEMLKAAGQKLAKPALLPLKLADNDWTILADEHFHRVVAVYVLNEFPLAHVVASVQRRLGDHLTSLGRIVLGDGAFPIGILRGQAKKHWADRRENDED